jgi:hypothetical protein
MRIEQARRFVRTSGGNPGLLGLGHMDARTTLDLSPPFDSSASAGGRDEGQDVKQASQLSVKVTPGA